MQEGLADEEVHPLLHLKADLRVEEPPALIRGGCAALLVLPGQADVSSDKGRLAPGLASDLYGGPVDITEPAAVTDLGELVLTGVKGEYLEHLGAAWTNS